MDKKGVKMIRKIIGWGIAQWFILSGKLRRQLKLYDQEGTILSLVGHDPTPQELEKLLSWVKSKGFTFVSTDDLLDGKLPKGRKAWLTFDDGWKSFKTFLPIFEKLNIPVTVFIAPHETERGQVWANAIKPIATKDLYQNLFAQAVEDRESFIDSKIKNDSSVRTLLTQEEIIELSKYKQITIENHTWSHLSCKHRPVDEVIKELTMCNNVLKEWVNRKCRLACYPFGMYTKEVYDATVKLGLCPVTCHPGIMTLDNIGYRRNMFREGLSFSENICRLTNAWIKINEIQ